jgi:hypothetical protein
VAGEEGQQTGRKRVPAEEAKRAAKAKLPEGETGKSSQAEEDVFDLWV